MEIKDKILQGVRLTEDEVSSVVYNEVKDVHVVQEEITDTGRWENYMFTVVKIGDRYFGGSWSKGATEIQENYYDNTEFYEVIPKEITKTIYVAKKE